MKKKKNIVLVICIAVFLFFIVQQENKWRKKTVIQMVNCAQNIELSVWDLDKNAPLNYLNLLLKQNYYKSLTVVLPDGSSFIHLTGNLDSALDRFFVTSKLVRLYEFKTEISHGDERIGEITSARYNTSIYRYFYTFIVLALIYYLFLYLQKLSEARKSLQILNQELDIKVQERTSDLSALTERYKAELEEKNKMTKLVEANEKKFRTFFMLGGVGMAITSRERGWIQVNHKLCEMLGYTEEELHKTTWGKLTHPDDLSADEKQFERLLEGEIEGYTIDKRFIKKDGSIIYTTLWLACLRDQSGNVDYFIAHLSDNTERKIVEQKIKNYNEQLEIEVQARTSDLKKKTLALEELNKFFVDRELKMVDLKKDIENLKKGTA